MKIEVNIEKKHFFGFLVFGLIVLGIVGVVAYNTNNPPVFGHTVGEINWDAAIRDNVSADGFCIGTDCRTEWWPAISSSPVNKIIAGNGISISSTGGDGTGNVTVDISAGAIGTSLLADSSVTDSKISSVSWSKITGAPAASTIGDKNCYWASWTDFYESKMVSGCAAGEYVRKIEFYYPPSDNYVKGIQSRVECCDF